MVGIVEIGRSSGAFDAPVADRSFRAIRRAALRMISAKRVRRLAPAIFEDNATTYVAGDISTAVAPASPDATLANLAWTFVGSH